MSKIVVAVLIVVGGLLGAVSGCGTAGFLPSVLVAVTEAGQVLDAIVAFVTSYFLRHPDADAQVKVQKALVRCRTALSVLTRVAAGAEKVDQGRIDQAFAEFKAAYEELLALTEPYGVKKRDGLAATAEMLAVPPAEAFRPQARR